ncbi:hypothetical protein V9T40_014665 [Parthenolecanium corni]|uniref:Cystinosin n=1 Tax=Parthenolecanium corni TaxID=536013 RepID=A0AAN9T6E1_9HEMI
MPDSVELTPKACAEVVLSLIGATLNNKVIYLRPDYQEIATVNPSNITTVSSKKSWVVQICAQEAGYTVVSATTDPGEESEAYFLHVVVTKYQWLKIISSIVGWIYFLAWSVSFYPQIYENYVRKSVVGLNFDFVALNLVGFALYSIYNCGMYYVSFLQYEYFDRHPKGLNPVQFNDVFFSVHAFLATVFVIVQCYFFERGDQTVSTIAKMILVVYYTIVLITGVLAYMHRIHWLDFLYYCSFIKLSVTLIKYIPQAVMNYTRKTTSGWSIGNVLFDFVGGSFSMLQMLLDGYNYNDWDNIFGDPTKFGLGMFSVAFDLFFMYQHYILYRHEPSILTDTQVTDVESKSES